MKANKIWNKLLIGALLVGTLLTPVKTDALSQSTIDRFKGTPTTQQQIQESGSPISVYIQDAGGNISKMNLNYPVMILNSRSAVAVKDITDNLGASLSWDGANRIATINKDGNEVAYPINRRVMSINDQVKPIDTNATIYAKENRTYLPFASLAEALGMQAIWTPKGTNGATQNSIILAPIGATAGQIPGTIQPPTPSPVVTPPPAATDSRELTAEELEFVMSMYEREGISRVSFADRVNRLGAPEYRGTMVNHFYRDIAGPKGWNIKTHRDLLYQYGVMNVAGVEFKTENGVQYQRVVQMPVNYERVNGQLKMVLREMTSGKGYNSLEWQRVN